MRRANEEGTVAGWALVLSWSGLRCPGRGPVACASHSRHGLAASVAAAWDI